MPAFIRKAPVFLWHFSWVWLGFWLALWLSWQLLAKVDFLYPVWYDHAGVKDNIEQYAPANRFKPDFELADRTQHLSAFSGIVTSIQQNGAGLNTLSYTANNQTHTLLHTAEIIHLQDVANLIALLNKVSFFAFLLWVLLSLYRVFNPKPFSIHSTLKNKAARISPYGVWSILASGIILVSIITFILGAEKVFYQLHIWVFPDNHQWFFYYEESLMSTMMKAPDLFAYIGASLLLLALVIFSFVQRGFQHLLSVYFAK